MLKYTVGHLWKWNRSKEVLVVDHYIWCFVHLRQSGAGIPEQSRRHGNASVNLCKEAAPELARSSSCGSAPALYSTAAQAYVLDNESAKARQRNSGMPGHQGLNEGAVTLGRFQIFLYHARPSLPFLAYLVRSPLRKLPVLCFRIRVSIVRRHFLGFYSGYREEGHVIIISVPVSLFIFLDILCENPISGSCCEGLLSSSSLWSPQ